MPISSNNSHITFNNNSTQNTAFLGSIAAANVTGTIAGPQIAACAVGTPNIAPGAVTGAKIGPATVAGPNIAACAVGTPNIAPGAVTGPKIGPATITAPNIAPGVIPSGGFSSMQVFTSPGTFNIPPSTTKLKVTVVGGGAGAPGAPAPTISLPGGACVPPSIYPGVAGGAGASGSITSFGAYQTATGGTVSGTGTAPGADLILDGALYTGRYGTSGLNFTTPSGSFNAMNFLGMGGNGIKIISAPFPVTTVPVTIGTGGGGGGGGGGTNDSGGQGIAGTAASGLNGGAGGNGSNNPTNGGGAGGGGGGGAAGASVGTGAAGGSRGGSFGPYVPQIPPGSAGAPGTGPFNRTGGGTGGAAGAVTGSMISGPGGAGGAGGHSGIVIVEF